MGVKFKLWWHEELKLGTHTRSSRPPPEDGWEEVHEYEAAVNSEALVVFERWAMSGWVRPWPPSKDTPEFRVEWSKTDECWQCGEKLGVEAFTAVRQQGVDRMVICCSEECRDAAQVVRTL